METQRVNIAGVGPVDFPASMSREEIAAAIDAAMPSTGADVAKSAASGVATGVINAGTMFPNLREALLSAGEWGARKLGADVSPERVAQVRSVARYLPMIGGPTGEEIKTGVESYTGEFHKPQTTAGRYAHTVGEFAPGAMLGSGNLIRKLLQWGVAPGAGSEYLGQKAEGTAYEPGARLVGALAGIGAGAGAGAAYTAGKNYVAASRAGTDLSGVTGGPVGAGAVRRVGASMEADRVTPQSAAATINELGDDAMLLDMGRQLRGRAEAVATQPGRGQNTVLDAVETRTGRFGEGTARRVQETLDTELGPTQNAVALIERTNAAVDRIAGPLYRQVMDAHPALWDTRLASLAERPAIAEGMKNAKGLAANYGETIDVTAKPSLRAWDYVKKDLDRRINAYYKSGGTSELNSADKADLGGLLQARKDLVTALDELTEGAYREARQASATKYQLREGYDFGRTAFNSRLLPEEFTAELAEMSVAQRHMAREGFRRELDRIIEATRNEGATARRVLDTNHVLQKLETLYGPQGAQAIIRRIGAENVFQDATTAIAANSRTAVRQELQKDTATPSASDIGSLSIPGMVAASGRGVINWGRAGLTERTRDQIADVLTTPAQDVPAVVRVLQNYNTTRAANAAPVGMPGAALINALLQNGSRQREKRQ